MFVCLLRGKVYRRAHMVLVPPANSSCITRQRLTELEVWRAAWRPDLLDSSDPRVMRREVRTSSCATHGEWCWLQITTGSEFGIGNSFRRYPPGTQLFILENFKWKFSKWPAYLSHQYVMPENHHCE